MSSIADLLRYENLTGVFAEVKSGIPQMIPSAFFNVTDRVSGELATWFTEEGQRQAARYTPLGVKARERELIGLDKKVAACIHAFESVVIRGVNLLSITAPSSTARDVMGNAEIARQLRHLKVIFENLRTSAWLQALAQGNIWFGADGHFLPTNAGAVVNIDYGIPNANMSWDFSDVKAGVDSAKKDCVQNTGYVLTEAFYGSLIQDQIAADAVVFDLIKRNPTYNEAFTATGRLPNGLFGLNWHYVGDAFYLTDENTVHQFFDDDQITLTPDPSGEWRGFVEGSDATVSSVDVNSVEGNSFTEAAGMYAFGKFEHNPASLTLFAGDTMLPLIRVPKVVYSNHGMGS